MQALRLVLATALCSSLTMAALASACDKGKTTASSASTAASMKSAAACCAGKTKASTTSNTAVAPIGKINAMAVSSDGAAGSCSAHGKTSATAAGSSCGAHKNTALSAGTACNGHGLIMGAGSGTAAHDCDACADLSTCENDIRSSGAVVQVVPIKNGVMYVYTADSPSKVQAVQSAMVRRNEHVTAILASGDRAALCPECKTMRGAIASGKLTRESVNIEGGCMTLVTSRDPLLVAKIHALAGVKAGSGSRIKT